MPKGGKRIGSGRKKGVPNKASAELKSFTQEHGEAGIKELVRLLTEAESEMVRVAAAKELLNRGYGKSAQPLIGDNGEGLVWPNQITMVVV